jgi:hypothetical protein
VKPTREIPMNRGHMVLVDADDYDIVMITGKWFVHVNGYTAYAIRNLRRDDGTWASQGLHAFLTGWPMVDHINLNGLDNRRTNLRPATRAQNMHNRRLNANNTSGYKGVSRDRSKWRAHIKLNSRQRSLGTFATPEQAARAYDAAARELFGQFARLNFPDY